MLYSELLKILRKVQSGEISVSEGAERLESLETGMDLIPPPLPIGEDPAPDLGWWKHAWMVPVWVGTGLFVSSAFLTSWAYINERPFWFYCSWLPLLFGLLVLLLGLWSVRARWAHLRIHEAAGKQINFSVPLPLGLPSWLLRSFAHRVPGLPEKQMEAMPPLLDALRNTRDPITVEVDDKDGDRVRIYII